MVGPSLLPPFPAARHSRLIQNHQDGLQPLQFHALQQRRGEAKWLEGAEVIPQPGTRAELSIPRGGSLMALRQTKVDRGCYIVWQTDPTTLSQPMHEPASSVWDKASIRSADWDHGQSSETSAQTPVTTGFQSLSSAR